MSGLSGVQVTGPLERYAAGFGAALREQGFGAPSARQQLQMTAQLSRWLAGQGLSGADLSAGAVEEFLRVRRVDRYARLRTHRALEPLLGYLREIGAVPAVLPPEPGSPVARLLEDYRSYLLRERGLAAKPPAGSWRSGRIRSRRTWGDLRAATSSSSCCTPAGQAGRARRR